LNDTAERATAEDRQGLARFVDLLRCPATGLPLQLRHGELSAGGGAPRYPITDSGIPLFAEIPDAPDARAQQAHYDRIAGAYVANLGYPHTQEYSAYLDGALDDAITVSALGDIAEICCGRGEAFDLIRGRFSRGVGVDISRSMLDAACQAHRGAAIAFVQGDATKLPLRDAAYDSVFMLGGIHHVNDRTALFREVARMLKPGGRFYFREPVSDLWLWLLLRAIIYRLSPTLDHKTERPLRYAETAPFLTAAGLRLLSWRTYGFLGFCVLMNSDVLVFNRLFRFIPGIRSVVRGFTKLDDWVTSRRGWTGAGLQVVGVAEKPAGPEQ
jgi:SAM-dependent methyltransferase